MRLEEFNGMEPDKMVNLFVEDIHEMAREAFDDGLRVATLFVDDPATKAKLLSLRHSLGPNQNG